MTNQFIVRPTLLTSCQLSKNSYLLTLDIPDKPDTIQYDYNIHTFLCYG